MRNRWIYKMTGLPSWMRSGFCPAWAGKSPSGLGPAAQYLATGEWPRPQMNKAWEEGNVPFTAAGGFPRPGFPTLFDPWGAAKISPEDMLILLEDQAEKLREALSDVEKRIQAAKGGKK